MRDWPSSDASATLVVPASTPIVMIQLSSRHVQRRERVDERIFDRHLVPRDCADQHDRGRAIDDRADRERADHADGHVELRVLALFGGRRRRVETDVAEEDVRTDRDDPVGLRRRRVVGHAAEGPQRSPADGIEVVQISGVHQESTGDDEDDQRRDLEHDEDVVDRRRLADADGEQQAESDHEKRLPPRRTASARGPSSTGSHHAP